MKTFERIEISGKGFPFCVPLPKPSEELIDEINKFGFQFEELSPTTIIHDALYESGQYERVQKVTDSLEWDVHVHRQFWTVYSDEDYEQSPLWITYFPDIWIDEIDFSSTCEECSRKRFKIDTSIRVPAVKSKKPLHSVNGQFMIVSAEVRSAIADSLVGACFHPFDEQDRYFYLRSVCDMGPLLIGDDEAIGYTGEECSQCKIPKFTTFLGPLRFSKSRWSGEDIVHESFYDGCLFTPKAFGLLRTFNRRLSRGGIALLD